MSQHLTISANDLKRIEQHQLGIPLGVYRLRPGAIIFGLLVGLMFLLSGCPHMVFALTQWQLNSAKIPLDVATSRGLIDGIFPILTGIVLLCIKVPTDKSKHLLICTQGLLLTYKVVWRTHVDVVLWQDISSIDKTFFWKEYTIKYQKQKSLSFSFEYQHLDELVSLIKDHITVREPELDLDHPEDYP